MSALTKIIARAKQIRKAHPKKFAKWTDYVKEAARTIKAKPTRKVGAVKKVARKKATKGLHLTKADAAQKVRSILNKNKLRLPHGYNVTERERGVSTMIGAIKSGSTFIYFKGERIEKKPIHVTVGKRKKKKYVFITLHSVFNSLAHAKSHITYLKK